MSATKIYEYIQDKKYSPAKALLSTELSKSPQSAVYKSLEALLAYKVNNRRLALDLIQEVLQLSSINSTVVNSLIAPVLLDYREGQLLNQGFEIVNRKSSADQQLVAAWIECALILGDQKMLCKALMANNKQQQTRKSCFQVSFALFLVWSLSAPDSMERKLYPSLAMKMLDQKLPVQSIEEFNSQAMVHSMQGKLADLVLSAPPQYQTLLTQQDVLDGLEASGDFTRLYDYAKSSINKIDSYNCWQGLTSAALALGKTDETISFAKEYNSANSYLALVDLAEKSGLGLVQALETYWTKFQTKGIAYEYLKQYMHNEQFAELIENQSPTDLHAKVNRVKLLYVASPTVDVAALIELYQSNLDHLPALKTDYFCGTDLLIIAALAYLKERSYTRAVIVLEYALDNDPSHFYVQLWLIHLYRFLGAPSKVTAFYERLAIKNMQHESLGHLVAERGASLGMDAKVFKKIKDIYRQGENMFSTTNVALEDQVYCQIPSMLELQRRLNCSLTRALVHLESLRSTRLNRGETDLSDIINFPTEIIDNRDKTTFFDPRAELGTQIKLEPSISPVYVRAQLNREQLFLDIVRGTPSSVTIDESEFTRAEKWSLECIRAKALLPFDCEATAGWEILHNGHTVLETIKLVGDIAVRTKSQKQDSRGLVETLAKVVRSHIEQTYEGLEDVDWALEANLAGAHDTFSSLTSGHKAALLALEKLIK